MSPLGGRSTQVWARIRLSCWPAEWKFLIRLRRLFSVWLVGVLHNICRLDLFCCSPGLAPCLLFFCFLLVLLVPPGVCLRKSVGKDFLRDSEQVYCVCQSLVGRPICSAASGCRHRFARSLAGTAILLRQLTLPGCEQKPLACLLKIRALGTQI